MKKSTGPRVTGMRTPYDQAEKAGKQILAKATEEHYRRKEVGKKDSYQAAKEAATFLVHQSRGRITIGGGPAYCCFECVNRLQPECSGCYNGDHFYRKGAA